jgi:hypothetical protein
MTDVTVTFEPSTLLRDAAPDVTYACEGRLRDLSRRLDAAKAGWTV